MLRLSGQRSTTSQAWYAGMSHHIQTEHEVCRLWEDYFKIHEDKATTAMKAALERIASANAAVDDLEREFDEKNLPAAHFDNERFAEGFVEGQARLSAAVGGEKYRSLGGSM